MLNSSIVKAGYGLIAYFRCNFFAIPKRNTKHGHNSLPYLLLQTYQALFMPRLTCNCELTSDYHAITGRFVLPLRNSPYNTHTKT